ncbi:MAG: protein-L-isoaspartate(D-aspartate) O-methyltransferase [Polyangiaceae bacterium]
MDDRKAQLDALIATLQRHGIHSARVLDAMREVPRDAFVPHEIRDQAFVDTPLPIGEGQTISQPYVVALMAEALALRGDERVLDVGTGSGYAAAILGRLAHEVHSVERVDSLARSAAARLARLGFANVHVRIGDGTLGLPSLAPFDAISVAAGGPVIPRALLTELAVGGRLVMPVGADPAAQALLLVTRHAEDQFEKRSLGDVFFVPLIGSEAWSSDDLRPR